MARTRTEYLYLSLRELRFRADAAILEATGTMAKLAESMS